MSIAQTKLAPMLAWDFTTDYPLCGMDVARETGTVLAWDEGSFLYVLGRRGELMAQRQEGTAVGTAVISDDGRWVVAACRDGRVVWCDRSLNEVLAIAGPGDPVCLATDAFGEYLVASSRLGEVLIANRRGEIAARARFDRPLRHAKFLLEDPTLVGASEDGMIFSFALDGKVLWRRAFGGRVNALDVSADGTRIVAAAEVQGVMVFDGRGEPLAPQPTPDSAVDVSITADAQNMLVATRADELLLFGGLPGPLWRKTVKGKFRRSILDAAGDGAWFGLVSGQVACIDFAAPHPPPAALSGGRRCIAPGWETDLGQLDVGNGGLEVQVLEDPPRIALLPPDRKLRVYAPQTGSTSAVFEGASIDAISRSLICALGRIVVVSPRTILWYNAEDDASRVTEWRFVDVDHCQLLGPGDLLLVEESQRVSRVTAEGNIVWTKELARPITHAARLADSLAFVDVAGTLVILNPAGEQVKAVGAVGSGEPFLVALSQGFVTVGGEDRLARGFTPDGHQRWEVRIPLAPWRVTAVGQTTLISSGGGETVIVDGSGNLSHAALPFTPSTQYFGLSDGRVARLFHFGVSLCCAEIGGRLLWRHDHATEVSASAPSAAGTAVVIGNRLCWFGDPLQNA